VGDRAEQGRQSADCEGQCEDEEKCAGEFGIAIQS